MTSQKCALKRPRDRNDAYDVLLPPAKRPRWAYNVAAYIRTLSPKQLQRMKENVVVNQRKRYAMALARGLPPSNRMHAYLYGRMPNPPPRPATCTGPVLSHPYSPPSHETRKVKVVWRRNGKVVTGTEVRIVDRDIHATAAVNMDTNRQKRPHDDIVLPDYDENENVEEYSAPSAKRRKPPVDTAPKKRVNVLTKESIARRIQFLRKFRNSNRAAVSNSAVTPWVPPKPADTPLAHFIEAEIKRIRASFPTTTKPASECGSCSSLAKSDSESDSDESDSESDTDSDTDSSGIGSGESDCEEESVKGKKVMTAVQSPKQIPAVANITVSTSPPMASNPTADVCKVDNVEPPALTQKTTKVPHMAIQRLISLFQSKLSFATTATTAATTKPAAKEGKPDCNPFKLHLKNRSMLKRTFISHQCAQLNKGQQKFTLTALRPATKCQFGAKGRQCLLPSTIDLVSKTSCGGAPVY